MTDFRKKILIAVPLIAVVLFILFIFRNSETEEESSFSQVDTDEASSDNDEALENDQPTEQNEDGTAVVDVKGEVEKPGIYEIDPDKRVDDALDLAGGLTEQANVEAVNRAEKVHDEMVVTVPEEGEESSDADTDDTNDETDQIRINQATQEEIEALSGIGPSKAEAIIEYREENGPFENIEDLLEVSGLGEKTLENLKDDILVP